jgi:glucosamine--fructose-6-phosphate aminotransferase (isomerizing)
MSFQRSLSVTSEYLAPKILRRSATNWMPAVAASSSWFSTNSSSFATSSPKTHFRSSQHREYNKYRQWWQHHDLALMIAVATATVASLVTTKTPTSDCSGILAVVASPGSVQSSFFLDGLRVYKTRGFDGVGMASIDPRSDTIAISKFAVDPSNYTSVATSKGSVKDLTPSATAYDPMLRLVQNHFGSLQKAGAGAPSIGMAHTRWATQGARIDNANVHPHVDASGKIALVHNGNLSNGRELRRELQGMLIGKDHAAVTFESQTDSEVIAKLIGYYYYGDDDDDDSSSSSRQPKMTLKEATTKALHHCDGTWGLCVMCADSPNELVVACMGSPLYIGIGDNKMFVASDLSVFHRYTKNYVIMKDGEIGVLHADGRALDLSRQELTDSSSTIPQEEQELQEQLKLSPHPYPHWTLKEIMEQPEAVNQALCFGARLSWEKVILGGLDKQVERLKLIQHMILTGCGSSFHAAKYGERIMKHLVSVPGRISSMESVEAPEDGYGFCGPNETSNATGLVAISQSGETKDTHDFLRAAMDKSVQAMSVVNTVGSTIARTTKLGVYCNAGHENAVPSTKSFTTQVTVLALIAIWFRELQDQLQGIQTPSLETERLKEALLRLPISLGMALKTQDQCKDIAKRLENKEHCFVLGKGED